MSQPRQVKKRSGSPAKGLSLRWAFILASASSLGLVVGIYGGIVAGIPIGLAAAAALHKMIA